MSGLHGIFVSDVYREMFPGKCYHCGKDIMIPYPIEVFTEGLCDECKDKGVVWNEHGLCAVPRSGNADGMVSKTNIDET